MAHAPKLSNGWPENIMLRPDGHVKVLDFGLAKLAVQGPAVGSEASTVARVETNPGVVMGTVQYMSPEQARGLPVDARTDVWSLGIVLYEMVASRPPFEGATQSDTIVSILEREPKQLTLHAPEAPAELERIVTKALTKDREERYQTVKDLAIDLRRLRRRLDVEAEIERSVAPNDNASDPSNGGQRPASETDVQAAVASARGQDDTRTSQVGATATTSSLEFAVTEIRRHKAGVALAGVLFIIALVGGGYGLYRLLGRNEAKPAALFQAMKITRLTNDGTARMAAISPDGRYVAYVLRTAGLELSGCGRWRPRATCSRAHGGGHLHRADFLARWRLPLLRQATGEPGASVSLVESDAIGALYQVPVLGGGSRRLLTGVDSAVSFSPDGRRLAFVRADPDRGETALMVANADGSGEQRLAARPPPMFT